MPTPSVAARLYEEKEQLRKALANLVGIIRSGPDKFLDDPMLNAALEIADQALEN